MNIEYNTLYKRQYEYNRKHTDYGYKLKCNISCRINSALQSQRTHKNNTTVTYVGCSIDTLKLKLESLFSNGMNWNNMGIWHVDHIIPCSLFNLENPVEQFATIMGY